MLRIMVDFGRLILLILFLPLFILFIGPLLILAVLRGRQPAGPVVLNTSRYGLAGRLGAFLVGLLLWAVTWGGLAWMAMTAAAQSPNVAGLQFLQPPAAAPTFTLTPSPGPASPTLAPRPATTTPAVSPATATPVPPLPTLVQLQDPVSPTPARPGPSPTSPATPTLTATLTLTATPAAAPTRLAAGTTASPAAAAEVEPALNAAEAAVAAVIQGNLLLRAAIISTTAENVQNLETIWHGQALRVTQSFVNDVNERYTRPLTVNFDYISPPTLTDRNFSSTATVTTRENWRYSAPGAFEDESFEFTYSITQEDGRWVIIGYTFRNLATPTATVAPASPTPTATVTPTVSG